MASWTAALAKWAANSPQKAKGKPSSVDQFLSGEVKTQRK
jgi:hypothetical protein